MKEFAALTLKRLRVNFDSHRESKSLFLVTFNINFSEIFAENFIEVS